MLQYLFYSFGSLSFSLAIHSQLQTLGTETFFWNWQCMRSSMSPNSVSAVLGKLIRRLCLRDFPCRYTTKVRLNYQLCFCVSNGWRMSSVCWALASFVVHAEGKWSLSQKRERRRHRKSWRGGDEHPPGWDVLTLHGIRITHGALKLHPWDSWLCRFLNASTPTLFTSSLPPFVF